MIPKIWQIFNIMFDWVWFNSKHLKLKAGVHTNAFMKMSNNEWYQMYINTHTHQMTLVKGHKGNLSIQLPPYTHTHIHGLASAAILCSPSHTAANTAEQQDPLRAKRQFDYSLAADALYFDTLTFSCVLPSLQGIMMKLFIVPGPFQISA